MRVLIIEDDPVVARWEAAAVQASPRIAAETFHVSTLAGALAFMRTTPVDAVVLDPGLPDSQGTRQAAGALAAEFPAVPILVVTGSIRDMNGPNVEGLVSKPVKAESLIEGLLNAIANKAARDTFAPVKATLGELQDSVVIKPKKAGPEQPPEEASVKDK